MNSTTPGMPSPRAKSQASTHKKRTRAASNEGRRFDGKQAPRLPPLSGDVFLQVSTHKSLRLKGVSPDQYGDNERMIELGRQVFDLVLTEHLYRKRPMLKVKDLAVRRVWAKILCVKLTLLRADSTRPVLL